MVAATRWIPCIPIATALTALALFLLQGGFGAGHGEYDQLIAALGLPSILLVGLLPMPSSDLASIIGVPATLNFLIAKGVVALMRRARG